MKFEWDDSKSKTNLRKHGIDFYYATQIFSDSQRIEAKDNRGDYGETRIFVLGKIENRFFIVIYTPRNQVKRIISARKANDREIKKYNKIHFK